MEITKKLQELTADQQISKGLSAAHALARQGVNAASLDEVVKALDTAEVGGGAEFVFTGMTPEVINQVRQTLKVSALFPHINMPTNPYKVPIELNPATPYLVPENTADTGQTSITASQAGTAGLTMTAVSIGAATRVSKELDQDSIVPMVPFIQKNLMRGLANGLEDALVNGDSTATHQVADTEAAGPTNVAAGWKGFRKHAIEQTYTVDAATWTIDTLRGMRKEMGKFGINPDELVLLTSNSAYISMLGWDEVLTLDKFGPNATVLTGELLKVDGIPVIVSPFMRQNLNATGVYDGTTTKTGVLLVHRDSFAIGDRQTVELDETDEPKVYRQKTILADMRVAFEPTQPMASNPSVVYGYNITS